MCRETLLLLLLLFLFVSYLLLSFIFYLSLFLSFLYFLHFGCFIELAIFFFCKIHCLRHNSKFCFFFFIQHFISFTQYRLVIFHCIFLLYSNICCSFINSVINIKISSTNYFLLFVKRNFVL